MASTSCSDPIELRNLSANAQEIRDAVHQLKLRGLRQSCKFLSELLIGIPQANRNDSETQSMATRKVWTDNWSELDRYEAAKAAFDLGEYLRANYILKAIEDREPSCRTPDEFLSLYALYLAGEKTREEKLLVANAKFLGHNAVECTQSTPKTDVSVIQVCNPHLETLIRRLEIAHVAQCLDGFGLYLYGVVLRQLGSEERIKKARKVLLSSIIAFPLNWAAWMELALTDATLSADEEIILRENKCPSFIQELFQAHVCIEQQELSQAHERIIRLNEIFSESLYLASQQALIYYHARDFVQSKNAFEQLILKDPHWIESLDVYSNVLYVKEEKAQLSQLAHRLYEIEKYRPETCVVVGNYYSLQNKHDRAILYYYRALKLDPSFLSAWTLIGHEYIELKNTDSAIEAYRRAVDLNARDYRAWYGLGQAYEILQMFSYSLYYYRKASSVRPHDARMWNALGGCFEKLGKVQDAVACFRRAVDNQDAEGLASFHLGRIYMQQQETEKAVAYFQIYLGIQPLNHQENTSLGSEAQTEFFEKLQQLRVDTVPAITAILYLAEYNKQKKRYRSAKLLCQSLLDLEGPEKEEAKALLREIRSLESTLGQISEDSSEDALDDSMSMEMDA